MPNISPDHSSLVRKQIAFAKLQYLGEIHLDTFEEQILTEWFICLDPAEQKRIKDAVDNFLRNQYPSDHEH
ncbi:MAG: hypothetical protein WC222_09250 [Parachlamydiales bacterium]|jgi:hypothetical protein